VRDLTRGRLPLSLALLAPLIAGCSGGGATQDTVPTAPPITAENLKSKAADVNAGAAGMKPPGVQVPRH